MPALAFGLLVLAGLIHTVWNIAAKKANGDARFACFVGVLTALLWAPAAWQAGDGVLGGWTAAAWGVVALSGVLHVAYFFTLLRAYRLADLTIIYPLSHGVGTLLAVLLACALFGERLSALAACGIGAVIVGMTLLVAGPPAAVLRARRGCAGAEAPAAPAMASGLRRGLGYGMLSGAFIAAFTVVDGYAVKTALLSPVLIGYLGNAMRALLFLPSVLADRAAAATLWRAQWKHALVVGAGAPLSFVCVLYAMRLAPLSHVAPARELPLLFAALLGGRLLAERNVRTRLAGAACIGAGVLALAK